MPLCQSSGNIWFSRMRDIADASRVVMLVCDLLPYFAIMPLLLTTSFLGASAARRAIGCGGAGRSPGT